MVSALERQLQQGDISSTCLAALRADLLELFQDLAVVFRQVRVQSGDRVGVDVQLLVCLLHGRAERLVAGQNLHKRLQDEHAHVLPRAS